LAPSFAAPRSRWARRRRRVDPLSAAFEAALVGGLPIARGDGALPPSARSPAFRHTATVLARRQKIVEGIVSMIEDEWLSPEVIGARLRLGAEQRRRRLAARADARNGSASLCGIIARGRLDAHRA
jgi:uncharacterized membrane-anchored protein YjiN (DUF445 family)